MERLAALVGIICVMQIGLIFGQAPTVRMNQPQVVEVQKGQPVTLECIGSSNQLLFYIDKRAVWEFSGVKWGGNPTKLTSGFYPTGDPEIKKLFSEEIQYYGITYSEVQGDETGYSFFLTINSVSDADDGEYSCNIQSTTDVLSNTVSTRLVVVSRVKKIKLQVMPANSDVPVLQSTSLSTDAQVSKLPAGVYDVMCSAMGSNPGAEMTLDKGGAPFYNLRITKNMDVTEERRSYDSSFIEEGIDFNPGKTSLVCKANIPNEQFDAAVASLNIMVALDKPDVSCENASAAVGDRYVKISCNLTSKDTVDFDCNKVHWSIGDENRVDVYTGTKKTVENYDIMEGKCKNIPGGIMTTLNLYHVMERHLQVSYWVVYDTGSNIPHRHMVELRERETSSAQVITPLSLLLCLAIAVLSLFISRHQ